MAVIGMGTVFPPSFERVRYEDISDGTERTILVGESLQSVPWTKPEDLSFETALVPGGFGSHHGYHNDGFNVLFADGSVRFLRSSITPGTLSALLSRNGSDDVSPNSF